MGRPGHTSVAIDNDSFGLLEQLSAAADMKKAPYLKHLIRDQAARHGFAESNPQVTIRHGEPVMKSQLSPFEQWYTDLLDARGMTSNLGVYEKRDAVIKAAEGITKAIAKFTRELTDLDAETEQ